MASTRNPDEVQTEYQCSMGQLLGNLFYTLWNDVVWLHMKWQQYRQLYGTNAERVEILNKTASIFFGVVQTVLWEDTLLHLSRLTGSPGARGKPNLSLQRLVQVIPKGPLCREIKHLINIAVHKADFAHEWRNRRIAHYDLRLAQGSTAISLPPASRQNVEEALAAIRDVMNRIDLHYRQSTTAYERSLDIGNGDDLLRCLEEALGSEKRAHAELLQRYEHLLKQPHEPRV
jgi:hypothetical protein